MKAFVSWLFSENNSSLQIGLFDVWHFLYLFVILGGAVLLALLFRKKTEAAKEKVIRLFAYLTIGLYVADFLIMPLSDSYSGISVYKLPFNICTIMAVLVPFAQFNPAFRKIKTPIVTLSVTSSLMWMCYPGSALGGTATLLLSDFPDLYVPWLSVLLGFFESGAGGCEAGPEKDLERVCGHSLYSGLGLLRKWDLRWGAELVLH